MTILIIHDDPRDCEFINRAIEEIDPTITCIAINNCREALSYLNDMLIKPNLIIMKLVMAKMDGVQFVFTLRENPQLKNIPVALTSKFIRNTDIYFFAQLDIQVIIHEKFELLKKTISRTVDHIAKNTKTDSIKSDYLEIISTPEVPVSSSIIKSIIQIIEYNFALDQKKKVFREPKNSWL